MSCGAEPGTSGGASGGPGDEKDEDMDSSHRINEPEDKEYPEPDTLTHSSAEADDLSHSAAYISSEEDSESGMRNESSIPRSSSRGAKDNGRNEKIQADILLITATLTVYQDKRGGELREK